MNKIKLLLLTIVMAFSYMGCENKSKEYKGLEFQDLKIENYKELKRSNQNIKKFNISVEESFENRVRSSVLVDTCYFTQLETKSDNLIGHVDEILIHDDKILVMDIYKSKSIFMFNLKGKYLRKIGDVGGAPGEYPRPEAFDIDKRNNEILVFNGTIRKILRYNFNGEFLGNINLDLGCKSFKVLEDGNIMLFSADYANTHLGEIPNRLIYIIDKSGTLIGYGPKRTSDYEKVRYNLSNNLISKNNEITYSYRFSDTIYSINETFIDAKYEINFGDKGIDREKLGNKDFKEFYRILMNDKSPIAFFPGKHFQTNNYLYFSFIYKGRSISCFFNKLNSELITGGNTNSLNSTYPFFSDFSTSNNDYFISAVDAYDLIQFEDAMKKLDPDLYHKPIYGKIRTSEINEKDNPILFFYRLKEVLNED